MEGVWSYLRRKPLQRRVTVMLTIAMAVAILLSNVAGYVALRATLIAASQSIALSVAHDLVPEAAADVQQSGQLSADLLQAAGVIVEAVGPDGNVIRVPGENLQLVVQPSDLASAAVDGPVARRTGVDATGKPYVVVSVPLGGTGYALVVGRPLSTVLGILESERFILLFVMAAGIVAAAVTSGFVARSSLRPVRQLTAAVEHVADTKDFQPIAIRYVAGDLATLAGAFNQLLRSI
ncbi:MAG TPA: HAMP domain-containing protein, partial [Friedmanniella sp.]